MDNNEKKPSPKRLQAGKAKPSRPPSAKTAVKGSTDQSQNLRKGRIKAETNSLKKMFLSRNLPSTSMACALRRWRATANQVPAQMNCSGNRTSSRLFANLNY